MGGVSTTPTSPQGAQQRIADIVRRLVAAAELFAERDPHPERAGRDWTVRWPDVPEAEALFDRAVADVVALSEEQLSSAENAELLTYQTLPSLAHLALLWATAARPVDREAVAAALTTAIERLGASTESTPDTRRR